MESQKSSKTSNLAIFSFILSISAILIAVYPYVRLNTPQEQISRQFYQPTIRYHIPEGSIDTQK